MLKRLTALLLCLSMALSLAGCRKKNEPAKDVPGSSSSQEEVVEKEYASTQAMDVFLTLDAVKQLKDFTFTLQINSVNPETGAAAKNLMLLTGSSFESLKQAKIEVEMEKQPLTTLYFDGETMLMDAKTAAECFAEAFTRLTMLDDEDRDGFQEDLLNVAAELPTDYADFHLPEDPWSSKEKGGFAPCRKALEQVMSSVKDSTASLVESGEAGCSLTLEGDALREELSKLTTSFTEETDVYEGWITSLLEQSCHEVLVSYGMDAEDWFMTKWEKQEQLHDTLTKENGDWKDWEMKIVTCGDASAGYTIDLTDQRETPRNYCLSVYPATAEPLGELPESTPSKKAADPLAELYSYGEIYKRYREEDPSLDQESSDELTASDLNNAENQPDELTALPMEGYRQIGSTAFVTGDGISVTLPVPLKYDEVEAEREGESVVDIFFDNNGYVMEYSSLDARNPQNMVEENMAIFEETFRDEYEYPITQTGEVKTSSDGKTVMGGIGYYDEDEKQDVTILTGAISVPESEYAVGLDIFIYSKSVTKQDIQTIDEMLSALGVELPLTITKN